MSLQELHESLTKRWPPEEVVKEILALAAPGMFTPGETRQLEKALPRWKSSMRDEFASALDLRKQLGVASELFSLEMPPGDSAQVRAHIDTLWGLLGGRAGDDFKKRPARGDRKLVETAPRGHRAYNKRYRMALRLEEKFAQWQAVVNIRDLARIAKSGLATRAAREDLDDLATAFFVAYLAARMNKRSVFTFGKQERAYDTIADLLYRKLHAGSNWFAVAQVYPQPDVLVKLPEGQKGQLLGAWFEVMIRAAKVLQERAAKDQVDLVRMIVKRGNDSSTWNEAAGAFNKARDGWIQALHALGAEAVLDQMAPGKALRLMAADVAWGHRAHGNGLEPDTAVWGALPKPWETLLGGKPLTRDMIARACEVYKIEGKGWIAPRPKTVAPWAPTPELVHGVIVSSPALAKALTACGYFGGSSKGPAKGYVPIAKTFDGTTVRVGPV